MKSRRYRKSTKEGVGVRESKEEGEGQKYYRRTRARKSTEGERESAISEALDFGVASHET